MAAPGLTARVRDVVEPVAVAAGLYLEDIEVRRAGARSIVMIVLDLDEEAVGSLDLDRIADVSRDISTALDALDDLDEEYTLEVSSPGASRPLTERRHFLRARGHLVALTLHDGTSVVGRLTEVDGSVLTVEPEPVAAKKGARPKPVPAIQIEVSEVAHGHVEVELSRALDAVFEDDDENDDKEEEV